MIKKIKDIISGPEEEKKVVILDPASLGPQEPDMRVVGLFADVNDEKVAEIIQSILYFNELNLQAEQDNLRPITFYLSTYGGNADDMFAMYDLMRNIRSSTEIHTVGLGKVMSAGVLLLAAGTKGHRYIGKNCRVMIHSVMEAIEQLQDMYCDALISETRLTRVKLKNMLERKVNVYLSAEEAVELGIADEII